MLFLSEKGVYEDATKIKYRLSKAINKNGQSKKYVFGNPLLISTKLVKTSTATVKSDIQHPPPLVRLTNRYFPAKRPADLSEGTIPISTFHMESRVPYFCLEGRPAAGHVLEVDTHNSIMTLSTSPMCSHCLTYVIELS